VAANPAHRDPLPYILRLPQDVLRGVKHLVDVDEALLAQARATLGTGTIKDTVNEALRLAADRKRAELDAAMDELAELVRALPVQDRASTW
jgi:Arc/MetJ family transcription regulator